MRSHAQFRAALLACVVAVVGCGDVSDDTPSQPADASVPRADAADDQPDATPEVPDATPEVPDATPEVPDAAVIACTASDECDDGVACTTDRCDTTTSTCVFEPDDANCDDGAFCNGAETCHVTFGCQAGTPPTEDDGVACTEPVCDEDADAIVQTPNHPFCDDGAFCNGAETCHATLGCQAGSPPTEDDGVDCTDPVCDEDADAIVQTPNHGFCADDEPCTLETCDVDAGCQSADPIECDPLAGCVNDGNAVSCGACPDDREDYLLDGTSCRTLVACARGDDQLRVLDLATAETLSQVTITLAGNTVRGCNGLAAKPSTGELFAVLKVSTLTTRALVTIDPQTGAATLVGDTGDYVAGLAFDDTDVLYAVTGDGGLAPDTLHTVDTTTGAMTSILALGNGDDGEALGFNAADGLLYHASGRNGDNVIFETIDLSSDPPALTNIIISTGALRDEETQALTWRPSQGVFLWKQTPGPGPVYAVQPTGSEVLLGAADAQLKGLAFTYLAPSALARPEEP